MHPSPVHLIECALMMQLLLLGQTALFKASQNDHKDAVRILLEANAQKDVMNYEQMKARDVTLNNDIDDMLH